MSSGILGFGEMRFSLGLRDEGVCFRIFGWVVISRNSNGKELQQIPTG
jgi:hypothetical protein